MKRYLLFGAMALFLCASCSSDKEAKVEDENSIIGTWYATKLVIDDNTASDDAKNGRDILNFLTAKDCYILSLTFNSDLSVVAENSANYVEVSVNSSGTGLEIPCPTDSDLESSTYTFDGSVLTVVDTDDNTVTVDVTIDGDTMTTDAADLDIPNFNEGGQLVFKKE